MAVKVMTVEGHPAVLHPYTISNVVYAGESERAILTNNDGVSFFIDLEELKQWFEEDTLIHLGLMKPKKVAKKVEKVASVESWRPGKATLKSKPVADWDNPRLSQFKLLKDKIESNSKE
jgi:hypothetical protein